MGQRTYQEKVNVDERREKTRNVIAHILVYK